MKIRGPLITSLLLLALGAWGEEPVAPAPVPDSPLVKAAKAGTARGKSTRKVIRNADVRKSKGKLIPTKSSTVAAAEEPARGLLEQQSEQRRAADEASVRIVAAQKKVETLEKDLRRIEQSFYDENDPSYRDNVIQKSFNQTKRQLDDARKELADARDDYGKANPRN